MGQAWTTSCLHRPHSHDSSRLYNCVNWHRLRKKTAVLCSALYNCRWKKDLILVFLQVKKNQMECKTVRLFLSSMHLRTVHVVQTFLGTCCSSCYNCRWLRSSLWIPYHMYFVLDTYKVFTSIILLYYFTVTKCDNFFTDIYHVTSSLVEQKCRQAIYRRSLLAILQQLTQHC